MSEIRRVITYILIALIVALGGAVALNADGKNAEVADCIASSAYADC